ncbi:efflux RND transporter periplasmic adaptor subunit [Massilia sp. IC2-476]|uniref:efflux RND transporter periplasmic adaptor subunit n=1 Tax=Massilia sp. IC2-476 TaxID=2887199 RepID=UPI001D11B6E1|nr:efflux RND transporter periplasmic adaptor subunit [Massilia sp. IC2-476]MCC2971588.1 efflux RND transporter periplasmic adaptor subunit [Massilia sp. IC2-476]
MKKHQVKVIAVMAALAIVFGGVVVFKGPGSAGKGEHSEAAEHGDKDEHKGKETASKAGDGDEHEEGKHSGEVEGVIRFSDEQIKLAGITMQTAAAAHLDTFIRMPGQIALNEDRTAHVTARAAGAVQVVEATLGQAVKKGDVLAVIASAEIADQRGELAAAEKRVAYARSVYASEKTLWEEKISARQDYLKAESELREAEIGLQMARQKLAALGGQSGGAGASNRLQVRAPFGGTIVEKHVALGEVVGADTRIFTVSDLSTVWADVVVPAKDLEIVRVGTEAVIRSVASDTTAPGKVSFVSSLIGEESRSAKARVVLDNPKAAWRPGLFVNVDIVTGSAEVPVAVAREALQTVEGRQVVFKRAGGGFVAQPVSVGRSDGRLVEIVSGMKAGEPYAGAGSFAIKAEQAKGDAEHEH